MAPPFSRLLVVLSFLGIALVVVESAGGGRHPPLPRYSRMFSFGDSLTDTGNAAILPVTAGGPFTRPPYGMTFFHHPAGRASDGRLVIDFLVEALGLPEPTPYLAGKAAAEFRRGANFAVGGATALDPAFLKSRGITSFVPVSLGNETRWFEDVLHLLAGASAHQKRMIAASSVFYFGEIGFNDYSFALSAGNGTVEAAASLVPEIIAVIRSAVAAVMAAGARTVVVAGMIPIGCEPEMLALFPSDAGDYYDPASGCIARFNRLAELHNRELQRALHELRRAHPGAAAAIVRYADLYGPVAAAIASPGEYGFGSSPLAACCGSGGEPYNFNANFTGFCATPGSTVCADGPSSSVSWDGIHYTEATNKLVARAILTRP
ncbi:GDSL esterase/lipase At1g28600-like [Oryza glaberrima]|uniref:GDSL esterase/lipase At1g28600-like n=1 Tax=Oryza glaberrima TaxID=4538 RepID=UPI00224C2D10|nr:GDSL esterase/lipase At1g28600-like [Oryza glaberrima]